MQIKQLSAVVDDKLVKLDQQLVELRKNPEEASAEDLAQREQDIQALEVIRRKLVKSRDLALEVHQLERATNKKHQARLRILGLALCGLSLSGLIAVGFILLR